MSLLVWLPLNGNLENWGSSPAKFSMVNSSGGLKTVTTGKTTANCYQRATANTADYITSDINLSLTGDVTIACWCKITGFGTNNSANGIVTQHGHQTGGLGITMKYIGASDYRMSINSGLYGDAGGGTNDRTYMTYYGNTNIYNAWHHLCVTYNSSTKQARLYVDGKLDRDPVALAGNNTTARPFRLFDWSTDHSSNSAYRPPCYLNDVRLYNNCLSAKEVKLLAQGLIAHYKLDAGGNNNLLVNTYNPSSTSDLAAVPATCTLYNSGTMKSNVFQSSTTATSETYIYSSRTPVIQKSTQYTFSCDMYANEYVKSVDLFWLSDTEANQKTGSGYVNITSTTKAIPSRGAWYHVEWTFTTKADDRTGYIRIDNNGSTTSGTAAILRVANLKLEKGSKASNYSPAMSETNLTIGDDSSGYGNHGSLSGTWILDSDSPRHNCCTVFNGTDTRIALNIKPLMQSVLKDKCTINFWVNETNTGSRSVYFGGYNGSNFNIEMSGGKFRVYWNGSPDIQTSSVVNGVWTMFTVVVDVKTGIKIYKNGVLEYTHSGALTDITGGFTNNTFRIGSDSRTDDTMAECKMSDFRIYCSALSDADIMTLYNAAGAVGKNGSLVAYDFSEQILPKVNVDKHGVFTAETFSERGQLTDMKTKILAEDNSVWARIFYHKTNSGSTLFGSLNEVLYTNTTNKYSRLKLLPQLKGTDGKYELMLTYPSDAPDQYNRWKQTNAPQNEFVAPGDGSANAAGYEAIHIDWSAQFWGGLTRQNSDASALANCYLSGSVGHGNWYYAIGANTSWNNGVPGFNSSTGVKEVELWVRIDTLSHKKKAQITKNRFTSAYLLQEI